jgi:demethylmenaquinone methyltransferase / 2-methoxy-6-polyprenyl-1,4-benzoquinol methylase
LDDSSTATLPVDKSNGRVREMFRQVAPRYDAMNHLLSLNIDRYWRSAAVKALRIQGGSPILDLCTGTGDLALAIEKHTAGKIAVVGSDFCNAMLRIAHDKQTKIKERDPHRRGVRFLEADSQQLPFSDNQFQCVTVAFGLRNIADTDRGLSEMVRVCEPGGQVLVLEFSKPEFPGFRQVYGFYFDKILPSIGNAFAKNDKSAYRYLQQSVGQFPDGQRLADRMTQAGLQSVTYTPLTFGVATIYTGFKPMSSPSP